MRFTCYEATIVLSPSTGTQFFRSAFAYDPQLTLVPEMSSFVRQFYYCQKQNKKNIHVSLYVLTEYLIKTLLLFSSNMKEDLKYENMSINAGIFACYFSPSNDLLTIKEFYKNNYSSDYVIEKVIFNSSHSQK